MTSRDKQERLAMLLDELVAAHANAALCVAEIRTLACDPKADAARRSAETVDRPVVDRSTLCVLWSGRACHLGWTRTFRLIERLARRPNHYVDHRDLMDDVWDGDVRSSDTLRSVVRHLRRKLGIAGMAGLAAAIRGEGRRYGLILRTPG